MKLNLKLKLPLILLWQHFKRLISAFFILLVRVYQFTLSSFIGRQCRYYPTCSNYAIEALHKHGPFKGLYLSIKRFISCNPWGGHGYDPVP